ncbi:olfactory receptor 1G1-like [Ornithorhynchus anatinus]|uniref:olfactory receptor 1G1-like n=1 Tax=Ornithorhynchus anatinus TaxID=9258 RepID=UPI0010A8484F|nr:olfactory receptor 1G1-like [Ornithorhynchus anatinus]
MERGNQTSVSEFLLLGLFDQAEQRQLLFVLFLWMYLLGVLGSLLIVLVIGSNPHLHTPMYFFLTNLSLADICFLSTTVPKMLVNIQTHSISITYTGCLVQMYFFILFVSLDHLLLTGMAYDRYVAICHPLHYTTIMSPRFCILVVTGSWFVSSLHALTHTLMLVRLDTKGNQTAVSEFFLLGLSDRVEQRQLLFVLFLWMFLLGFLGSLLIVLVIGSDSHLHTPMYFFLTNLSLADICFLSTTVPKMLVNIQTHSKSITYAGCMVQMYFFILFGSLDHFLLTGMAYDRYVAICHPLHYTTIMSPWLCALTVAGSWITVVSLFYGTALGVYFSPPSTHTARRDSIASVMYSVVTPMLNPFIYSLRNKDMKAALRKFISRKSGFFQRL